MILNINTYWFESFYSMLISYNKLKYITTKQTLINIESAINELYISISINSVSFVFSFITIILAIISFLSDNNHENENTGLYYILVISTICLIVCSLTQDLF